MKIWRERGHILRCKEKKKGYELQVQIILPAEETIDVRKMSILEGNRINGLFQVCQTKERILTYIAPQGSSLEERMRKPISRYDFYFILEQIVILVCELQRLSLPIEFLIYDSKRVYINEVTKELRFLYLPLSEKREWKTITSLVDEMIYSAKPEAGQDVEYISRFAHFYKNLGGFDVGRIEAFIFGEERSVLDMLGQTSGETIEKTTSKRETNSRDTRILSLEEENWLSDGRKEKIDEKTAFCPDQESQTGMETVHIFQHRGSEVFGQKEKIPTLYRRSTGERIPITKPLFRIGREEAMSDYCISDNKRVGRNHAEILLREDLCYLVDKDSKNNTFLNGKKILPQIEIEIHEGDVVTFADEEFTVVVS